LGDDIGNPQREMRRGRVLIRALGEGGRLLAAEQVDLSGFADIHPKTGNAGEVWPSTIGGEPEKPLIEIKGGGKTRFIPRNAYALCDESRRR
jgi:hypothetical protein